MNIKVTLLEFTLLQNLKYVLEFETLVSEVLNFNPNQLDEQLSLDEKKDLILRIENCLSQI